MLNHECEGCQLSLPVHLGIHLGEASYFPCTRPKLEIQPLDHDVWHQPSKRVRNVAPFVCGGDV